MPDNRYRPQVHWPATEMPFRSVVNQIDPEREARKRNEIEYEFSGRVFRGDPTRRGPYADD